MEDVTTPFDYVIDGLRRGLRWSVEKIKSGDMAVVLSILVLLINLIFYTNLGLGFYIFLHGLLLGAAVGLRLSSSALNVVLGSILIVIISAMDLYLSTITLLSTFDWLTVFTAILDLLAVVNMIIWLSIFRTK